MVEVNVTDADAAHRFLHPSVAHLHDPFLLTDMRPAVDRLQRAIQSLQLQ